MSNDSILVADIGGTHARFALADLNSSGVSHESVLECADFPAVEDAIIHYIAQMGIKMPSTICIAAAGPVTDGCVSFVNSSWHIDTEQLRVSLDVDQMTLVNDFVAVAHAVSILEQDDLLGINGLPFNREADRWTTGVIGPGTGLGAAGLVKKRGHVFSLLTEAGHSGFSPTDPFQFELMDVLAKRHGRVSNERLLSGPGIENIYRGVSEIVSGQARELTAKEVFAGVNADANAKTSVDLFFKVLGQVAGDFALSIGAFDGVFLAGGVVQRYASLVPESAFQQAFQMKGRLSEQLEKTPTFVITHQTPGLLGAAQIAREEALALG